MTRDPLEPNLHPFAPAPAEACTDVGADAWTHGIERRAYRDGWRWGLVCGLTAGAALLAAALLVGLKAGAA